MIIKLLKLNFLIFNIKIKKTFFETMSQTKFAEYIDNIIAKSDKDGSSNFLYEIIVNTNESINDISKNSDTIPACQIIYNIDMGKLIENGSIPVPGLEVIECKLFKNDEAKIEYRKCLTPIIDGITLYYYTAKVTLSEEIYYVKVLFYSVCVLMLTEYNLCNNVYIKSIFERHISAYNHTTAYYKNVYNYRLDMYNKIISQKELYNLGPYLTKEMSQSVLNMYTKLRDYQIHNVNHVLHYEHKPYTDIILPNIINIFNNGIIYDRYYNKVVILNDLKLVRFKGCVIADEPGIGKTLEMLTVCKLNPVPTLIVVSDLLKLASHWETQICIHFQNPEELLSYITIISMTECSKMSIKDINKYKRIIIDEAHLIYTKPDNDTKELEEVRDKLFINLTSTDCEYKWLVTGTPFTQNDHILKIIKLLIDDKSSTSKLEIRHPSSLNNRIYDNLITKLFRRNIRENLIDELHLPEITFEKVILKLSKTESNILESLLAANYNGITTIDFTKKISNNIDLDMLRRCCSMVISALFRYSNLDSSIITVTSDQIKEMFLVKCKTEYEQHNDRLTSYMNILQNLETMKLNKIQEIENSQIPKGMTVSGYKAMIRAKQQVPENNTVSPELLKEINGIEHNISHYNSLIINQRQVVDSSKAVYDRYNTLVTVIEGAASRSTDDMFSERINESDECPICMCPYSPEIAIYKCDHFFCAMCSDQLRKSGTYSCPMCRTKVSDDEIIIVQNKKDAVSYGTKIDYLLKILKKSSEDEKIILMTQFDNSINVIERILNSQGFIAVVMNSFSDLEKFKSSGKILILSATSQSAGLDLSFASTMIMLEPPNGDYSFRKDLVKQIVGRIYRIGQTKPVKVITLIAEKTIEEMLAIDL
jgi:SNF2 family DNA or RNA helicase